MISEKLLHKLYWGQKLSMVETAERIHTTPRKIEYWLKKYKIPRRSWSESAYVKQNPDGDPFNIKRTLNQKEKELLTAGLMLYLGEGGKKSKHSIQLGNIDSSILQVFLKFLREICQIREDKVRIYVRVHKKFNKNKARVYWSNILKIPQQQVLVYTHNDPRSKPDKQRSEHGIATLQFNNMKLRKWLDDNIKEYLQKLLQS